MTDESVKNEIYFSPNELELHASYLFWPIQVELAIFMDNADKLIAETIFKHYYNITIMSTILTLLHQELGTCGLSY